MGFISNILSYSPSVFLVFNKNGVVKNLANTSIKHEAVGGIKPQPVSKTITPSAGGFGGGLFFDVDNGRTKEGSCAYRIRYEAATKDLIQPKQAITVLMTCTKPKKVMAGSLVSCTEFGGWNIEMLSDGRLIAYVRIDGQYRTATTSSPVNMDADFNMLVLTYDGKITALYNHGQVIAISSASSNAEISYNTAPVNLMISAEVDNLDGYSSMMGLAVEHMALIPNVALSAEIISDIYDEAVSVRGFSGTLLHDDGTAGSVVRVRSWSGDAATKKETDGATLDVAVDAETGFWSVDAPQGNYELVMVGKEGYEPIAHGPMQPL